VAARRGDRRGPGIGRAAVDVFEACEAFGAARELATELGASGTALRRPVSGWDSLTPTERAVAGLVGEGLTNGEIAARRHVSRRTVESHLVRVYTKVGYSSRTRLAVEATGGGERDRGNG
jgi:DNA-binding CsgD family transcriptional regulator